MERNGRLLIIIQIVMSVMSIYFYTFITAEFYEVFGEGTEAIRYIAQYFLIAYFFAMVAFLIMGTACKKNAKNVLIVSTILNGVTLFLIVTGNVVNTYIVIAIVFGISQGLYYSPVTNLISKLGRGDKLEKFCTTSNLANKIASFVFPITVGAYIEVSSFRIMASILLVIVIVQLISACMLEFEKPEKVEKLNIIKYLRHLKTEGTPELRTVYAVTACDSVTGSILDKLITILIIVMYSSSFTLGALNTVFAIIQIGIVFVIKMFLKSQKFKDKLMKFSLILAIFTALALVVFAIFINTQTFILYEFLGTMSLAILGLLYNIGRYNSLPKCLVPMSQEHQSVVEIIYGIIRIVGFAIIIAITMMGFNVTIVLRIALCLCAIVIVIYGNCVRKLQL